MPKIFCRRLSTACLAFALVSSVAVADKYPENEIFVSQDENGIDIFSNISPTPAPGAKNKMAARAKATVILPVELGGKSRVEQSNAGHQATSPVEISDSQTLEDTALPVDNNIHKLHASEEPQDH